MKIFRKSLFLLLAGSLFLFSACDDSEDPFEIIEPEVLTPGSFNIHTYRPDMTTERVLFKGSLSTNGNVTYGFQWYVKPQDGGQVELVRVEVGQGSHSGEYTVAVTNLPRNTPLVVCAFVEYQNGTETTSEIGEEIDFDWDL